MAVCDALKQGHVKGILAQEPLALSLEEAKKLRDEAKAAGKILSMNDTRYDQSMRVLKQIMDSGALGEIVFAQIDMHAIPHWQTFLEDDDRLNALEHERPSPRCAALSLRRPGRDHYSDPQDPRNENRPFGRHPSLDARRFPSGVLAVSLEDVWSGPRQEGYKDDQHITWRVEGTQVPRRVRSAGPQAFARRKS